MRLLKCWGGLDCTYTKQTKHLWENRPKSSAKPRTNKYGIYLHGCVSRAQIRPQLLLFLLPAELTVLLAVVLPSSVILHHYDPGHVLRAVDLYHWGCALPWLLKTQETGKQLIEEDVAVKNMPLRNDTSLEWKKFVLEVQMASIYNGGNLMAGYKQHQLLR